MSGDHKGVTQELAGFGRGICFADIPAEASEVARHCLLDWFGVALAGGREPLSEILRMEVVAAEGGGQATLVGSGERATVLSAALWNGAASHALDFDDTHMVMMGHPSVPVWPAILALAERENLSGRDLLAAFVTGVEVECRLGALTSPGHYGVGFHSTGTLGTFGACAASAHLLGLDEEGWLNAMGLAGTQAAGLKSGFGTMAKPLHAGKAAANGLLSALLARSGYTANQEIIETEQGFAETHHGGESRRERLERYAGRFLVRETLFKYHAACYLTHSAIEGALALRGAQSLGPDSIGAVELEVAPASLKVCNLREPQTGLEGKFSLRATTAMALLGDDTSDLAAYEDARMRSPDLIAMRDRISVKPVEGVATTCSTVIVETREGTKHRASVDVGVAACDLGRQWDRLSAKFSTLATPVLGETQAAQLSEAVARVDELPVRELLALAVPVSGRGRKSA